MFLRAASQNKHRGKNQAIKKQWLWEEKLYFLQVISLSYMLHLNCFEDIFCISKQSKSFRLPTLVNK